MMWNEKPSKRPCDQKWARQHFGWRIGERCFLCAAAAFLATLVLTHPPFGMGGPNFLLATLVAIAAAAMTAGLASARTFYQLQQTPAAESGASLSYRLGRWFHAQFVKKSRAERNR